MMARRTSSPPPIERVPSEDPVYGEDDQDGAQSVMQPALSVVATRLTLPQTSAAEKAAAMASRSNIALSDALHPSSQDSSSSPELSPFPDEIPTVFEAEPVLSTSPSPPSRQPSARLQKPRPAPKRTGSPKQSTPRNLLFGGGDGEGHKSALESISFGQTRHKRSSSTGADALKRFSKALPSFPAPSSIFNSLSFFTAAAERPESRLVTSQQKRVSLQTHRPHSNTSPEARNSIQTRPVGSSSEEKHLSRPPTSSSRPSTARPRALRRVTSDDSLLYHSLSRTSSVGDDDGRFDHVREMANVRMKAIKDSLPERPTFKMPSLPKLPSSLKLNEDAAKAPELSPAKADIDSSATLDRVLNGLTGDIVILGGYRGSILRSAEPPHHQLWAPVKIGLNMRKADLEVGLDPEDEETMEERIIPSGMLQNIGPIDISRKLFRKIAACDNVRRGKLRLWDYGYDWRLSPHLLSRKMAEFLEKLPSNQPDSKEPRGALVLAHSLGGLITRHVVNQRPELFSGVVYVGTPQRCINVLGPLRDGDAVLLNEKILTAQVNFSLRTTFVFLPDDGCCFINKDTKEEYHVDFHDVNEWVKYRLTPCVEPPLPPWNPKEKTTFGSLLPLRNRASSDKKHSQSSASLRADAVRKAEQVREGNLNPQIDGNTPSPFTKGMPKPLPPAVRAKNLAYLERTLSEVKRFRAETQYHPQHAQDNVYPPMAVIYGKEVPTVAAVKVSCREAIGHSDAYEDLLFRAGDGVVLAREAQLPEGYEIVRGGRVSTTRGHLNMLGDLPAVGTALEAIVRGRRKGIGMGLGKKTEKAVARV
ncbi:Uncharacterized protein C8035_v011943 [Colletotrichum spinosum]|uniref:Phosphatidylcholine-sterol O-acyltransferase-like protein n=1 Tax=Colletotrichum spinosum TaxID=1347390 RepID=A0A4R8PSM4_9PEZI|nr:Uncharacterized protein C8035_v011943 [Colletotrichum spinosum]